jgi:outer membrane protein insertion porin family
LRTSEDVRYYQSLGNDLVAMVRGQGGYITGWGGQQVPLINSFFGGPGMVRGFAPNGFGPRDLTPGSTMDNVGGSMYWATTAELQSGIPWVPDEYGLKASAFVDAGSVFGYKGPTTFSGQTAQIANANILRSSTGVGLTWASPFGALTASYAVPLSKAAYDVQFHRRTVFLARDVAAPHPKVDPRHSLLIGTRGVPTGFSRCPCPQTGEIVS